MGKVLPASCSCAVATALDAHGGWKRVWQTGSLPLHAKPLQACQKLCLSSEFTSDSGKTLSIAVRKATIWKKRSLSTVKSTFTSRRCIPVTTAGLETLQHNQALWSAGAACIAAQFLKPLTSFAKGKGFDIRLVLKSGGMPSSHAASVTALATAVGLLRGFDDPVFAACAVGASIVMYDAQGVRRAVGKQAEVINTLVVPKLVLAENNGGSLITNRDKGSEAPNGSSSSSEKIRETELVLDLAMGADGPRTRRPSGFFEAAMKEPSMRRNEVLIQELDAEEGWRHIPLKESVGHTKREVAVGALAGIVVAALLDHFVYGAPH